MLAFVLTHIPIYLNTLLTKLLCSVAISESREVTFSLPHWLTRALFSQHLAFTGLCRAAALPMGVGAAQSSCWVSSGLHQQSLLSWESRVPRELLLAQLKIPAYRSWRDGLVVKHLLLLQETQAQFLAPTSIGSSTCNPSPGNP